MDRIKILFVCHGNICRSPMAEFIFKDMIQKQGIEEQFLVNSCATSTEEIWNGKGNPVYPPAKSELAKHGIGCEGKYAVQLQKSDYEKYDLLICMDSNNVHNAKRIVGNDSQGKIHMLMEYTNRAGDVSDPWYSRRFDVAYEDINLGCEKLLYSLLSSENIN